MGSPLSYLFFQTYNLENFWMSTKRVKGLKQAQHIGQSGRAIGSAYSEAA